jgi:biopolymer transport protein ExbB/TolQ
MQSGKTKGRGQGVRHPLLGMSRPGTTLAAFLLGLPIATGVLAAVHHPQGPLHDTIAYRYLAHPIGGAEVVLFCCALGGLFARWWLNVRERLACRRTLLPDWEGEPVPASEAPGLLTLLGEQPRRVRKTSFARRLAAALDFVCQRRSADDLDQQLRTLSDNDALALDESYALHRFITWAIPILGFLGTVLGITGAIAGITPDTLEESLSGLTGGLALAFDSTALALGLTMIAMFLSFLVERREQASLETIDYLVEQQLAHRFQRSGPTEDGPFLDAVQAQTRVVLQATEDLVRRQASIWAEAFAEAERSRREQEDRLAVRLEEALERTLDSHAQRLLVLQQQMGDYCGQLTEYLGQLGTAMQQTAGTHQEALFQVAREVGGQGARIAELLARLQDGEADLLRVQQALQQNLQVIAATGNFEQAVHSLTAAAHLLTARMQRDSSTLPLPQSQPPRAA